MFVSQKRKVKTSGFALFVLVVFAATVFGCKSSNDNGTVAEKKMDRRFMSIGTAPLGGAFAVVGDAIAQVVGGNAGELGWQVSSEATKGTQENIRRLVRGELDFGMANAAVTYFAVRGEGEWQTAQAVQAVMTLAPNVALFITPKSSGIKTLADLKSERVVVGPSGAGFEYFLQPILKEHGITFQDFTPLNNTQAAAVDMLADGSAAAAFLGGAVPTASITQAAASQDIFFIPFDNAAMKRLIETYPFFEAASIPAKTYRGQTQPFEGLNVGSMHLITAANMDEETVYQFTKILYEHREEVVQKHPAGRAINPQNAVKDTGATFHPGAIRYYKEIGVWPGESQQSQPSAP